jgi:S-adenosylmethionine decarboxylase
MRNSNLHAHMNGMEWVVDAHGCVPEALRSLELLQEVFQRLISELCLRPIGEIQWHQFPDSGGITGLCLLAESHLACHTFPEFGSLCLNLFCCVPREPWNFEAELNAAFGATSVSVRAVTRQYGAVGEVEVVPVGCAQSNASEDEGR